jgi:hypothetical protein
MEVGRPEIPIDWNDVEEGIKAGDSGRDVAEYLGISPTTLYERCVKDFGISFTEYICKTRSKGKHLIRAKQLKKALSGEGDNTMLIYLGKVLCGQQEKVIHEHTGKFSVRSIVERNERETGDEEDKRCELETRELILDTQSSRQEDEMQIELGSERAPGELTSM